MDKDEEKQRRQSGQRGVQAERLLKNKIFREVFGQLEEDLLGRFRVSKVGDDDERLYCRVALGVIDNMMDQLETAVINGRFDAAQIVKFEEQRKDKSSER